MAKSPRRYMSEFIVYTAYNSIQSINSVEAIYLQRSSCCRGFYMFWRHHFANSMVDITICQHDIKSNTVQHVPRQFKSRFCTWIWLRIAPFIRYRLLTHHGCDRLTGDTYYSYALDPTSGISRVHVCHEFIYLFVFLF